MKKNKKPVKPEKVTFETVAHFLPEGYFEQYDNPELNEELREEFEKRIRKANRPVGVKTAAVLDRRSKSFQELYVKLKGLTEFQAQQFENLCEEIAKAKVIIGSHSRQNQYAKIADTYLDFIHMKILLAYVGTTGKVYECEVPGMSFALDMVRSLKSYYSYAELL